MSSIFQNPLQTVQPSGQWLCVNKGAGEAEKVKAAQASFSWKCPLFFGIWSSISKAFRVKGKQKLALSLEVLNECLDVGPRDMV